MSVAGPIVASKIEPPTVQGSSSVRAGLLDRISDRSRYISIVAPPGFGKSVLAREIHAACAPGTAAWLSVDLLDRQPVAFWSHLIAALRGTIADIDDEPVVLLAERSASDFTFLASLCEQIRVASVPLLLVLDDVDRINDLDVLTGIEHLGEWADGHLRLVVTGRVDPALPLARWRATGLLTDLRQDDLRFDRAASRRFAEAFAPGLLAVGDVDALHDRVEGWPVALQVALMLASEAGDPSAVAREMVGTNRLLADYVTGEVLDALGPAEREVALGLSVLEWFDLELCRDLLGDDSLPPLRRLLDRRVPITELEGRNGYRFHRLIRELLESELRWRDPGRFAALHRVAGELTWARHDRLAAARHFLAAGDPDRASEVVAQPAIELLDTDRVEELRQILALLPPDIEITAPEQAADLAFGEFLVGRRAAADRRLRRATELTYDRDDMLRARLLVVQVVDRMLAGDGAVTRELITELDRLRLVVPGDWPLRSRVDGVVARCAQFLEYPDADERIAAIERSSAPRAVVDVVVPAITSLVAFQRGDLTTANELQARALAGTARAGSEAHPAMYDAHLASGWCAWAAGDFDAAREFADRAFAHPLAAFPMWWLRVAALATDCLVRSGAAAAATELIDQLDPDDARRPPASEGATRIRARALIAAGRPDAARDLLLAHPSSPSRDLLLGWAEAGLGRPAVAGEFVADVDTWPAHRRIEALVLRSTLADPPTGDRILRDAVALAAVDGWVGPLLGHGDRVDFRLGRMASGHPQLADALAADERTGATVPVIELTEREITLVELLPTHLSYSQMGERLYLSVNTIKSNLKSVYRKLGASTRDEAIRAARRAGLLDASAL